MSRVKHTKNFFITLTEHIIILLVTEFAFAQGPATGLSLQGFTGLLNTPNANVTQEGSADLQYNTERKVSISDKPASNMLLSFGLFSNMELSGRIFEQDRRKGNYWAVRDMSANVKLWLINGKDSLAVGAQDIGGGATFFKTAYVVGSRQIGPTRLSMGYGTGPDRLSGVFGGLEWTIFDNLDFIAEHDTVDNNFGIRLRTPESWIGHGIRLGIIAKQAIEPTNHRQFEYGIGLTIPFGSNHYLEKPLALSTNYLNQKLPNTTGGSTSQPGKLDKVNPYIFSPFSTSNPKRSIVSDQTIPSSANIETTELTKLENIGRRIVDLGLENVRIGVRDNNTVYVEYENHRYNHNELDALGIVMGTTAIGAPESLRWMAILVKKDNLPVIEVKIPIEGYRDFLAGPHDPNKLSIWPTSVGALWGQMTIRTVNHLSDSANIRWVDVPEQNHPWARMILAPAIPRYFLATEFDVLDYALTLNPELEVPLWKGGVLSANWSLPLLHTKNLDEHGIFGRFYPRAELYNLWLQQGMRPSENIFELAGVGLHRHDNADYVGVFNDIAWIPGGADHRFRGQLGYLHSSDEKPIWPNQKNRKVAIGAYRYFYVPQDLSLEAMFGRFWYDDRGLLLKATRFFGDASVAVYYKDTNEGRAAGLEFSIPLTPRQDMKPKFIQFKGKEHWTIGVETTLASTGQSNNLRPDLAIIPTLPRTLGRNYLNYGRLSAAYIRNHILRLREAYARWGEEK
ncbi:putative Exopolysaccharide biosynthesis protein YbjH [Gammaproteobacteria bacterium]